MASTTLLFAQYEPVMKTHYLEGIRDNTNRATVLLKRIQRNSEDVGGNFAQLSLLTRGNKGVGSRGDSGSLPDANYARHTKATFGMKTLYGRCKISGKTSRASNSDSFERAVDVQMQSLLRDLPREHNRMLFGTGSGEMATVGSNGDVTNAKTFTCDNVQYLEEGDILDSVNLTSGTVNSTGLEVESVDTDNNSFVATAAATAYASTIFVRTGSFGQEIYGLETVCSTGNVNYSGGSNFGGINRTSNNFWKVGDLSNGGTNRPLTTGLMQQAIAKSATRGGGMISLGVCDHDMWITYGNLLSPNLRFQDLIKEIDGGFQSLDFAGVPIVPDRDCQPNRMFMLDEDSIFMFEYEGGYEWMDADGSIFRYTADKDEFEFTLLKDAQLGCDAVNRQVVIRDLSENVS